MDTIADRYQIAEEIGAGGAAVVYRVQDLSLDVVRAVKLLSLDDDDDLRSRMRDEAKAMANLEHPHICRIYDVGIEGKRDFVVMEYVEDGSLFDRLERKGPIPPEEAVGMMLQVLAALEHAHAAGIVHRDVKPSNILVDSKGDIRLCDFGIALVTRGDDRRTMTGMAMGSLPYMPPEQRRDARAVDAAADQYAAGATLYRLITNETPVDLYLAPKLSSRWDGVPESIADVIRVATAARVTDRYPDVGTLSVALCRALERRRELDQFEEEPPTVPSWTRPHRRKNNTALIAVSATTIVAALSFVIVMQLQESLGEASVPQAPIEELRTLPNFQGIWMGTWNGEGGARAQLSGTADHLTGYMWIPLGEAQMKTRVEGAFDLNRNELILRDIGNTTSPGVYVATMDDDMFMSGSYDNGKGGQASFKLLLVED